VTAVLRNERPPYLEVEELWHALRSPYRQSGFYTNREAVIDDMRKIANALSKQSGFSVDRDNPLCVAMPNTG